MMTKFGDGEQYYSANRKKKKQSRFDATLNRSIKSKSWYLFIIVLFFFSWWIYPRKTIDDSQMQSNMCLTPWMLYGQVLSDCHFPAGQMDVIYTWSNGSDPTYAIQRQFYVSQSTRFSKPSGRRKLARMTKHQREHGELEYSVRSTIKNLGPNAIYVLCSDFEIKGQDYLIKPSPVESTVKLIGTRQVIPRNILPVFNSLSIESYLHNIPHLTEMVLYLNDDTFLCHQHSTSDFFSPLTGPHFHISRSVMVRDADLSDEEDEFWDSEWHSLKYTSLLLSQKFGARSRGYVEHIGKMFSRSIMSEVADGFENEIEASAQYKFREGRQINMLFLTTWYTIEMTRQIFLDLIYNHFLDSDLANIDKFSEGQSNLVASDMLEHFQMAGIAGPRTSTITWTFLDGYPFEYVTSSTDSTACSLALECLNMPNADIQYLTKVVPQCGDCLLRKFGNIQSIRSILLKLPNSYQEQYINALHRYAYSISETSYDFVNLREVNKMAPEFDRVHNNLPAQLCINDDAKDEEPDDLRAFDVGIREFLGKTFPS